MITEIIERLLLTGSASYHTFVHSFTAVSKITVPPKKILIVLNFNFYPFYNLESPVLSKVDQSSIIVLDFFGKDIRNSYIVKVPFEIFENIDASKTYIKNGEPVKYNTFLKFERDFYLSILINSGMTFISPTFAPLINSELPPSPVSYGNTQNVVTVCKNTQNLTQYIPTTPSEAGVVIGQYYVNVPTCNEFTSNLALPHILNNKEPLINIGYVIVDKNIFNELCDLQ